MTGAVFLELSSTTLELFSETCVVQRMLFSEQSYLSTAVGAELR